MTVVAQQKVSESFLVKSEMETHLVCIETQSFAPTKIYKNKNKSDRIVFIYTNEKSVLSITLKDITLKKLNAKNRAFEVVEAVQGIPVYSISLTDKIFNWKFDFMRNDIFLSREEKKHTYRMATETRNALKEVHGVMLKIWNKKAMLKLTCS